MLLFFLKNIVYNRKVTARRSREKIQRLTVARSISSALGAGWVESAGLGGAGGGRNVGERLKTSMLTLSRISRTGFLLGFVVEGNPFVVGSRRIRCGGGFIFVAVVDDFASGLRDVLIPASSGFVGFVFGEGRVVGLVESWVALVLVGGIGGLVLGFGWIGALVAGLGFG